MEAQERTRHHMKEIEVKVCVISHTHNYLSSSLVLVCKVCGAVTTHKYHNQQKRKDFVDNSQSLIIKITNFSTLHFNHTLKAIVGLQT